MSQAGELYGHGGYLLYLKTKHGLSTCSNHSMPTELVLKSDLRRNTYHHVVGEGPSCGGYSCAPCSQAGVLKT